MRTWPRRPSATWRCPAVWYVDGNMEINGDVTFSGYGVFIVDGKIDIKKNITTDAGPAENTLALYATGKIEVKANDVSVAAQLFANKEVKLKSNVTLYGSITSGNTVKFEKSSTIYYREPPQAITDLLWPTGGSQ